MILDIWLEHRPWGYTRCASMKNIKAKIAAFICSETPAGRWACGQIVTFAQTIVVLLQTTHLFLSCNFWDIHSESHIQIILSLGLTFVTWGCVDMQKILAVKASSSISFCFL